VVLGREETGNDGARPLGSRYSGNPTDSKLVGRHAPRTAAIIYSLPRCFRIARLRTRRLCPRMKRRPRALGVILLRRHLRRGDFSVAGCLAAFSAAIARSSSSASLRSSAMRGIAAVAKFTQYSPGKRLSVSPRARSSRATSSKRESESGSTIYSACARLFRRSTALIDSRRPGPATATKL
jgi:hypothetical protein